MDAQGSTIERATTKREAERMTREGFAFNLWHRESRWFAGETPAGMRSWEECRAERDRLAARQAERAAVSA